MFRLEDDQDAESRSSQFMERKLLETRTILIYGGINQKVAHDVTKKLLLLAATSDDDINIFLNSQGGHVESGDTIFDMIRYVKPKVNIIGTGWVVSAGALIYISVPTEQRYSLPHTRYMIHQPSGGTRGQASDIAIEAKEIVRMRERLNKLFAEQTGQPLEKIEKDCSRDYWMSAEQAVDYGLVGKVINNANEI